jgi:hypothetical protein
MATILRTNAVSGVIGLATAEEKEHPGFRFFDTGTPFFMAPCCTASPVALEHWLSAHDCLPLVVMDGECPYLGSDGQLSTVYRFFFFFARCLGVDLFIRCRMTSIG